MARHRLGSAHRQILHHLRSHQDQPISYDDIAAETLFDRRHVVSTVRQLEAAGKVRVNRGAGRNANRYDVTGD
jgi:DNA-binding IscR family transcriptional regulator